MTPFLTRLCAGTLAFAMAGSGITPAMAAPVQVPAPQKTEQSRVIQVQSDAINRRGGAQRNNRGNVERQRDMRQQRQVRPDRDRREVRRDRDRREIRRDRDRREVRRDRDRREIRRHRDRREARRDHRRSARFHRRGDHYYYRGHRGYRQRRSGYRQYNGWWFPAAAFVAGAIVSGSASQSQGQSLSQAHVDWCYQNYRSYRSSDDTFQPYNGPRKRCNSPYN